MELFMNITLQDFEEMTMKCKNGLRKEKLELKLKRCREVYENINIIEMELLWYIRQSRRYNAYSYLIVAKKIFEAKIALDELTDAAKITDVDKR